LKKKKDPTSEHQEYQELRYFYERDELIIKKKNY